MTTRYVLYSEEAGVYLGSALGLGFWSELDPVGQPAACSFASRDEARFYVRSWNSLPDFGFEVVPVETAARVGGPDEPVYVTVDECVDAGLPGWSTEA